MIRFSSGILCLVLSLIAAAPLRAEVPVVLVLGDSLSAAHGIAADAGWVTLLGQRLAQNGGGRAVNASISGETTAGGLSRLPALLAEHAPDVVAIELGANDGLRGLPIAQVRENLSASIKLAREAGAKVLLIGIELPINYGARYRGLLRDTYAALAREHDVPLVPFLLDGIALEPGLMQDDGLHPTAQAQPRILDTVWPALEPLLAPARK